MRGNCAKHRTHEQCACLPVIGVFFGFKLWTHSWAWLSRCKPYCYCDASMQDLKELSENVKGELFRMLRSFR